MTSTNRAGLFYENLLESASTITATSEASADTPVENIYTFQPGEKWRSSSASDQDIIATFAEEQDFRFLALFNHNLEGDATVRIRISDNSDLSDPSYDGTFYAWQSIIGWDQGQYDYDGWDGIPIIEDLESWQFRSAFFIDLIVDFNAVAISGLNVKLPAEVARINGDTETTSPDGQLYQGYPIACKVHRHSLNFTRADSEYLHMTNANFGTTDAERIGFTTGIKRTSTGTQQRIIDKQKTATSDESYYLEFDSSDRLHLEIFTDSTDGELLTTATYTDTDNEIIVTWLYDANEDAADRLQLFVDGVRVTAFDTETQAVGNVNTSTGDVYIGSDSAGTKNLDAKLYNTAFFSGALPVIGDIVCCNGQHKELADITALHSLLMPDWNVGDDYVLATQWTNENNVTHSTTVPTNYGQVRYVESFNATTRTAVIDSNWSAAPEDGDAMRIDMTDAIGDVINDGTYSGLYLGITISDSANADGYLEIGYAAAGGYVQPIHGANIDHQIQVIDPSQKFRSVGGATWVSKRTKYRMQSFGFGFLTETEANTEMDTLAEKNGGSKPIIWLPYVENSGRAQQAMAYGLLQEPPTVRQVRQNYTAASWAADFTIEELR